MTDSALILLSPCTIIRVSGSDALRFLNGQLTNDVALATSDQAIQAAALNAKGGLEAICSVRKCDDDFLLDAPLSLRDPLMERLDRYLIADDVTLTDESEQWFLAHLLKKTLDTLGGAIRKNSRYGLPGFDFLTKDSTEIPKTPSLSEDLVTELRIENGIPAWGAELSPGLLPPEAGLQETTISYEKGCYLGQEVISRMKWAGKTNRHLVRLEVPTGTEAGSEFFADDSLAGVVTTVSPISTKGKNLALGFRKRKFEGLEQFQLSKGENSVQVLKRLS